MRLDHLLSKGFINCRGRWGRGLSAVGRGPGSSPLLISCFPPCAGARRGLRLAGGVWGAWHAVGFWGGAPWCPGPLGPSCLGGVGGCGRVGCELHSGREHLRAAAVSLIVLLVARLFVFLFGSSCGARRCGARRACAAVAR